MRFEVSLNGEQLCVAGLGEFGVLSAILSWVKRDPEEFSPVQHTHTNRESWSAEESIIDVSGLSGGDALAWVRKPVREGDEIVLRVLPPGVSDPPQSTRPWHGCEPKPA